MENIPINMKAALLHQPFEMSLETFPVPQVGEYDALVKVMAVGICGSDVHYYEHGKIGKYVVEKPIILGHECAGEIVAIGEKVTRFKKGDRVAIEPGVTCGVCQLCKKGHYNLCPDVQFMATPPVNGAFTQYVAHREDFLFPIPDDMSYEEAALIEPFSVGLNASMLSEIKPGSTVAILGMGPVGLMAVVAVKAFGAKTIIVSDVEESRLSAAQTLGATHVINVKDADPVPLIRKWTKGIGADVVFETAGNKKALQTGVYSLAKNGTLAVVGLPVESEIQVNIPFIVDNQLKIKGVFRYANTYKMGVNLLHSNAINAKILVTDKYPLDQIKEAMERARTNKKTSLKVMVYPNGIEQD